MSDNFDQNAYDTSSDSNEDINTQTTDEAIPTNENKSDINSTASPYDVAQEGTSYTPEHGSFVQSAHATSPYSPYFRHASDIGSGASYTFSNDPSYGANNTQSVPKQKKSGGLRAVALALVFIFSITAAAGGGALASYNFLMHDPNALNALLSSQGALSAQNAAVSDNNAPVSVNKVSGSTTPYTTMTEVIAAIRDSVVEIVTENITESQYYGQYVTSGAGSGVIITADGYIITNNHVVEGANNIYVRTTDGKEYKASLVGTDAESDIAVIKIEAFELSYATLGDSSAIKLGEEVIAIGNPLGSLGGTVTNGIISALDRNVTIDGQKMVLLQTNAAVNPGNSGGGLFNMAGELIGVVNAKSSSSSSGATIEGLGFAIPINHAFDVASQLIEYGYVKGKVSLGITVTVYEKDVIYKQGFTYYTIKAGVYVDDPGPNTELKKDDRLVSIDGVSISSMADIKSVLSNHKIGDTMKAKVIRVENKKEVEIELTITCYEYTPTK